MGKLSGVIKTEVGVYIGDPCYVIEDNWDSLVTQHYAKHKKDTTVQLGDYKVGMVNTEYGDGVYVSSEGDSYPVDSGLLGVVPLEVIDINKGEWEYSGTLVNYQGRVRLSLEDGVVEVTFLDKPNMPTTVINTR